MDILHFIATGDTIEDAVEQALEHFGCSRAEIDITIRQTPRKGLLGLGRRPAEIRVKLTDRGYVGRTILKEIIDRCGLEVDVGVAPGSDLISLNLEGADTSLAIGRKGQTLEAFQYLTNLLTDRVTEDRTPLEVDSNGYRNRRRHFLDKLARRLSAQVRRTGQPTSIQSLPPQERKIFHLSLKRERGVDTRSVGRGYDKKILIIPDKG